MKQRIVNILTAFVILLATGSSYGQYITTVAGTVTTVGYDPTPQAATATTLNNPSDLATDAAGNLYVADFVNNAIRKIDTFGMITTVAGTGFGYGSTAGGAYTGDNGPATAADLNGPYGLALDAAGNIYFADGYNHVVRKVSTAGIITTVAGMASAAGYSGDNGAATAAKLNNPVGIAIDKAGNVYIADDHNNAIRKLSTTGIITTVAGGNSTGGYGGDGSAATLAQLNQPIGVAIDTAGNLYIADELNQSIRKVNTAGVISTFAGIGTTGGYTGDGGQATLAKLDSPQRVTFDNLNNCYISDGNNNVIRMVNTVTGIISTVAGNGSGGYAGDDGPATAAEMQIPQGVAFDLHHRMYIADRGNQLIRMVGPQAAVDYSAVKLMAGTDATCMIYPNPSHGSITVNILSKAVQTAQLRIVNVMGQTIKKWQATTNNSQAVKLDVPAGVYFLHAETGTNQWNKQITIE